MQNFPVSLYHGTSSLFIPSIIEHGLGGKNLIKEWRIIEFTKAIYPLIDKYLSEDKEWKNEILTFKYILEQKSTNMNFQHGDTYLSPSKLAATRYSISNQFGSEILSCAVKFTKKLKSMGISEINEDLSQEYKKIFEIINTPYLPVLIELPHLLHSDLLDEHGKDAMENIEMVINVLRSEHADSDIILQQTNFRLRHAIHSNAMKFWKIKINKLDPIFPDVHYEKYE